MCVVSYIGDYFKDKLPEKHPWTQPVINPIPPWSPNQNWPNQYPPGSIFTTGPTREEFDALRKEVEELKKLLLAGKEYDKNTNQPSCELEEKVELIKRIAKLVGVDMRGVFDD